MRLNKFKFAGIFLFLLMAIISAPHAQADTVYTYTGNPYTTALSPYTTSMFVSVTFTLAAPLGNNFPFATITPASYSVSDGLQTLTNLNSTIAFFQVGTGPSGIPTSWTIRVDQGLSSIITDWDSADAAHFSNGTSLGIVRGAPGTWTVTTSTPEPGTLGSLSTGMIGLGLFLWLKRKRQAQDQPSAS